MRPASSSTLYKRHSVAVRVMHWVNVIAVCVLLMSGLQIFNAHPALHWGLQSYSGSSPWLEIGADRTASGAVVGVTRLAGKEFQTTGVLGAFRLDDEHTSRRAFPSWATLPGFQSLALGRRWHFLFAWIFVLNGTAYWIHALLSGHLRRDLLPTKTDLRGIGRSIVDHLRFRHPKGEAARRYNVLQKLAYLLMLAVILPGIVIAGLGMSPAMAAVWPEGLDLLGGRQSARSLHFLAAVGIVGFVAIHVFEVIITGPLNNLRSMLTGNYRVPAQPTPSSKEVAGER